MNRIQIGHINISLGALLDYTLGVLLLLHKIYVPIHPINSRINAKTHFKFNPGKTGIEGITVVLLIVDNLNSQAF